MSGYIERLRSPAAHAVRDAGPPNSHVLVALAIAVVATVALWNDREATSGAYLTVGVIALLLTSIVSIADRDGWLARAAMTWIALAQRSRWPDAPGDAAAAGAWLDDPANTDAPALRRASVMIGAGRWSEASDELHEYSPTEPPDVASWIRIRSVIDARTAGRIDDAGLRIAVQDLPPAEAKFQLASSAWSQVWLDVTAGRPWRKTFVRTVRELRPFPLPRYARLWIAAEQMLAPIACVLAIGLAGVISILT